MLLGRAITTLPISRANAMTVLRNLSRDPLRFGKRGDQVAHQLRLSNAPGMPANNDHSPIHFPFTFPFLSMLSVPAPAPTRSGWLFPCFWCLPEPLCL